MSWQPIETCPPNTDVLCYSSYNDQHYFVSRFHWRERIEEEEVSRTQHESYKRKIIHEKTVREREWTGDGWGAEFWMPLPEPPPPRTGEG